MYIVTFVSCIVMYNSIFWCYTCACLFIMFIIMCLCDCTYWYVTCKEGKNYLCRCMLCNVLLYALVFMKYILFCRGYYIILHPNIFLGWHILDNIEQSTHNIVYPIYIFRCSICGLWNDEWVIRGSQRACHPPSVPPDAVMQM